MAKYAKLIHDNMWYGIDGETVRLGNMNIFKLTEKEKYDFGMVNSVFVNMLCSKGTVVQGPVSLLCFTVQGWGNSYTGNQLDRHTFYSSTTEVTHQFLYREIP